MRDSVSARVSVSVRVRVGVRARARVSRLRASPMWISRYATSTSYLVRIKVRLG